MVRTHPTWFGTPFQVYRPDERQSNDPNNDVVRIYPTDLFADGSQWVFLEYMSAGQYTEAANIREELRDRDAPRIVLRMQNIFFNASDNSGIWVDAGAAP